MTEARRLGSTSALAEDMRETLGNVDDCSEICPHATDTCTVDEGCWHAKGIGGLGWKP